jgi:hypothetical protein
LIRAWFGPGYDDATPSGFDNTLVKGGHMPRIRPLTKDEVGDELRGVLEANEQSLGKPGPGTGIQAYAPAILDASKRLSRAPAESGLLSPQLRSLVCLRAAEIVGCPF